MHKKKIILHCGAPKTGSTSLQFYLSANEKVLNKNGVYYPHKFVRSGDVDPFHLAFNKSDISLNQNKVIHEARSRLLEIFQNAHINTVLISNEGLLGDPIKYPEEKFFPDNQQYVSILHKIFDDYDVSVKYFIRDYASYIPSYYVQYIRRGGYCSLYEFVKSLEGGILSWERNITLLEQSFGRENLEVFDYNYFIKNPDATVLNVLNGLIRKQDLNTTMSEYKMNQSVGGFSLYMSRLCNEFLVKTLSMSPIQAGNITRNKILKTLSRITPNPKPELPKDIQDILTKKYEAELSTFLRKS